jgi:hypothetical protein
VHVIERLPLDKWTDVINRMQAFEKEMHNRTVILQSELFTFPITEYQNKLLLLPHPYKNNLFLRIFILCVLFSFT